MNASSQDRLRDADRLLDEIGRIVSRTAPALSALFALWAGEARFGRALIDPDLRRLRPGAGILEVGAGSFMLSCVLQREGFLVTALEPTGSGFSHFRQLQAIVLDHAARAGMAPAVLPATGETLALKEPFDFAFSVNVMEHVGDVGQVLQRVHRSLMPGAAYRFVCPNYAFPYDPHFNIPTLFNRSLTHRLLRPWIKDSAVIPDSAGMWASLNWITVSQVRRLCRARLSVEPAFNPDILAWFFERALSDPEFQARRGRLFTGLLKLIERLQLARLVRIVPVAALPVMDCTVTRPY
jgi:2-polyprenyl-3-methyl-5-hydroxy-6-metoxy-1,4-benzoquinol methylase